MACLGCYKKNVAGYCVTCRNKLFDGKKVPYVLSMDPPRADNVMQYRHQYSKLSISGAQLKYSLKFNDNTLELTSSHGQYILKPIPVSAFLKSPDQVPLNEHLTMQIASQLFNIKTADNALIFFKDGTPAYITRRFDVQPNGVKYLQEDMTQITGRTAQTNGEHFKYQGTYEEIGKLICEYVPSYQPTLETFFRIVVFNYIFSNGDAHLKNFSLLQTNLGDYALAPAYDLLCTVLHTPGEYDTAIDLYKGDIDSAFYDRYGFFGRTDFEVLAERLGIMKKRAGGIIDGLLEKGEEVEKMVRGSFLDEGVKEEYLRNYRDKRGRFGLRME